MPNIKDNMMQAVRLHSVSDLRCDRIPVPVPKGRELLIKVGACGICGSDLPRVYEHGSSNGLYPLTIGHEFAGEVIEAGELADRSLIGVRAAVFPLIPCRSCDPCVTGNYAMCEHYDYLGSRRDGGFAEYCLIPSEWQLIPAHNASMEALAMTEPACVAQHAVRKADVAAGQFVVIFGAGPIGIMAARWAELFGAGVLLVDIAPDKVAFAREKGFLAVNSMEEDVEEAVCRYHHGKLADAAIEGTGAGPALNGCISCVRAKGVVSLLGNPSGDAVLPVGIHSMALRKEIVLHGVWNSSRAPYPVNEWEYTVRMMDEGKFMVTDLITDYLSLEELPGAMEEIHKGARKIVKAMYAAQSLHRER